MPNQLEQLKTQLEENSWNILDCQAIAIQALKEAAHYGNLEVLNFLITGDYIDINYLDEFNMTALIYACNAGHIDIARFLIHNGADVDTQIGSSLTPLMWACKIGNAKVAHFLIDECKADINLKDKNGCTAFDFVTECHHPNKSSLINLFSNIHAIIAAHNEAKKLATAIEVESPIQGKERGNSDLTEYSALTGASSHDGEYVPYTSFIDSLLPHNNHDAYAPTKLIGSSLCEESDNASTTYVTS